MLISHTSSLTGSESIEEIESDLRSWNDQLCFRKGWLGELALTHDKNRLANQEARPPLAPKSRAALLSLGDKEVRRGQVLRTGCWERETQRGWTPHPMTFFPARVGTGKKTGAFFPSLPFFHKVEILTSRIKAGKTKQKRKKMIFLWLQR